MAIVVNPAPANPPFKLKANQTWKHIFQSGDGSSTYTVPTGKKCYVYCLMISSATSGTAEARFSKGSTNITWLYCDAWEIKAVYLFPAIEFNAGETITLTNNSSAVSSALFWEEDA